MTQIDLLNWTDLIGTFLSYTSLIGDPVGIFEGRSPRAYWLQINYIILNNYLQRCRFDFGFGGDIAANNRCLIV